MTSGDNGHSDNGFSAKRVTDIKTVCDRLLLAIVHQSPKDRRDSGFAIALTSATPDAGVSYITRVLMDSLGKGRGGIAISVDCWHLQHKHSSTEAAILARHKPINGVWQLEESRAFEQNWHSIQENVAASLEQLRREFSYILVDCPSLKDSPDALRIAPLVDGIVLVIEADRTQKQQILHAERTIELAKGRILGHVLNKRSYPIPDWLSQRMEAVGM
jgi:hypothetical protein